MAGRATMWHTQMTLWKGSSPRNRKVRTMRKTPVTSVTLSKGAMHQVRKTGPRPDRKGGLDSGLPPPKLMDLKPGNTRDTPTVAAAASHTRNATGLCLDSCSDSR